jgi:hypothetical protein
MVNLQALTKLQHRLTNRIEVVLGTMWLEDRKSNLAFFEGQRKALRVKHAKLAGWGKLTTWLRSWEKTQLEACLPEYETGGQPLSGMDRAGAVLLKTTNVYLQT